MICVNMLWLHKTGRFSFGYFLVPGVSWRENCKSKHSRKLQLWVKSHSLCHKPLREWLLTQGAEGIIQKTRHEGLNADLGLRKSIFKVGSDFWKELDPRGDAQIPGGEDGNDFFFFNRGIMLLVEKLTCRDWVPPLCHWPSAKTWFFLDIKGSKSKCWEATFKPEPCALPNFLHIPNKNPKIELIWDRNYALLEDKKKIMRHLQTFSIN